MPSRTRHRWSGWLRGVTAWGLVALGFAVPAWGFGRVISLAAPFVLAVAITGTVSALSPRPVDDGQEAPDAGGVVRPSEEWRWWGLVAVGCASAVLCLAVTASVASVWVLFYGLVLVLTSPPLRAVATKWGYVAGGDGRRPDRDDRRPALRARWSSAPARAADQTGGLPCSGRPDARIADLDTTELCHLWRVTFWMVKDLRSPVRTVRVVELRQAVLDELEQRRPDDVTRWLTSGHHVADGPGRYL